MNQNWIQGGVAGPMCWGVQTNLRKTRKTNVEIFYVVSVRMSGEIILGDRKVG